MGHRYRYMLMSRCEMDLKFYINTMSGHCGNCREDNLFFGSVEKHIAGSLRHYRTLPVKPVWLSERKLKRLCSRAITLKNRRQP